SSDSSLRLRQGPGCAPTRGEQRLRFRLRELVSFGVPCLPAAGAPPGSPASRHHQALASRARLRQRGLVHRELALRVSIARVEESELPSTLDQLSLLALGACHAGALGGLL